MSDFIHDPEETKELLPRFRIFYITIYVAFTIFFARLWYLQVISGGELRAFSEKNHIKQVRIDAPRGLIVDDEGRILVENAPGFEAYISPQYVEDIDGLAQVVAPIIGTTSDSIIERVKRSRRQNGPFANVRLKENLTREEVYRLKTLRMDYPGLDIREVIVRSYPMIQNGSQLFGYVGEISRSQLPLYQQKYPQTPYRQGDIVGKNGLEELFELPLRGEHGVQFVQVDAYGRETREKQISLYGDTMDDLDPVPGARITLTLDRDLQEAAWKVMEEMDRIGGIIAMRPSGEILAWVSRPGFDPNEFARGISNTSWRTLVNHPFKPLRNKVIQDHYPPGSTFKAFTAVAALEEKIVSPTTLVQSPGSIRFGNRDWHDHLKGGHGIINIFDAIERSSNVFFYKMGMQLGIDRMHKYIAPFGFGARTGVELPREARGLMPSAEWKMAALKTPWQAGENLPVAIGQGFVATSLLQLVVGYNAIATKGKVVKPFVVRRVESWKGELLQETQPQILRDLTQPQETGAQISEKTFDVVKEGLRRVVMGSRGTARRVQIPGVEIAGKTGTAQVRSWSANEIYKKCDAKPIHQRHHGWFIGFAPFHNPEIIVGAFGEHACSGSAGAGPMARAVLLAYFEKHYAELLAEAQKKGAKGPSPSELQAPAPEGE